MLSIHFFLISLPREVKTASSECGVVVKVVTFVVA